MGSISRLAVVLAAGKGTRMRSRLPKVLHQVAGQPMVAWPIAAARAAGCKRILVVVGEGADAVREALQHEDLTFVVQAEQLGTGHAVLQVAEALRGVEGKALVLSGDVPLVQPATIERLFAAAEDAWGALAMAELEEPGALGRVLHDQGSLRGIVEAADATAKELLLRTVNAGLYVLPVPDVFSRLERVGTANAQGELYLTDALVNAARDGELVRCIALGDIREAWGINDRRELAKAHLALIERLIDGHLERGVTFLDPASATVEASVAIDSDCVVHPDVTLLGSTKIGPGCVLHRGVWLRDCEIAEGVEIHPYSVLDRARVGAASQIGPFARLRPGACLAERVRIGNFVEVKASELGPGTKASHLAYLGDASVGAETNIGAGVVTCNYDGEKKHRTIIGERAFIGSDTMLVAPVEIGDRVITGAGSVITDAVPDDTLALGRARQRNLVGWTRRRKK